MGHFYDRDGNPRYSVVGANGVVRDSTLADARKNDWVPSVTTIFQAAARPALDRWKLDQHYDTIYDAVCGGYNVASVDVDDFKSDMREMTKKRLDEAPSLGTDVHNALEAAMLGHQYDKDLEKYVVPAMLYLRDKFGDLDGFAVEQSFCDSLGFGGKTDVVDHERGIIIDYKTKKFGHEKRGRKVTAKSITYDEHIAQLAAYSHGLDLKHPAEGSGRYNMMISVEVPGLILLREWTLEEEQRGWEYFEACFSLWKIANKYDPAQA